MRTDSLLIHGGVDGDKQTGAVNVPIYLTSTFRQAGLGEDFGWEYARTGNPTRCAAEKLVAELEGGVSATAYASGMAAITAVLSLFKQGSRLIVSRDVYGGTFRVLDQIFKPFGITYESYDMTDLSGLAEKLTEEVKAVYIETPSNPLLSVTDIQAVAEIAHAKQKLVIADNTFMTPYLQKPLELGADVVIHSGTKYLSGHSDTVCGFVVVKNEKLGKRLAFIQNATGGVLPPFDSFLTIRGIKTLGVRMDRHVKNATELAAWLAGHPAVKKVYYPGLESDPGYALQRRQARGAGGVVSFELRRKYDARKMFKSIRLITFGESLGGVESLMCHPATMSHASVPREIREAMGITDGLIRLSAGIEDVEDLKEDLERAFRKAKG
jgi:cystathionine beta-lyase/cystathionine gamma-synthase